MGVQKRRMALLAISLTSVLASTSAWAGGLFYCTDIDIRNQVSSELKAHLHTPISQGSLGWCGHYTATELLSQKLGTPLSASYTGMANATYEKSAGRPIRDLFKKRTSSFDNGERIRNVILNVARGGKVCKARALSGNGQDYFDFVFNMGTVQMNGSMTISNADFFEHLGNAQKNQCGSYCQEAIMASADHFLGITSVDIVMKFLKDNPTLPVENVALSLMNYSCRNDFVNIPSNLQVASLFGKPWLNSGAMLNMVDRVLESGRLVGLTYDVRHVVLPGMTSSVLHASVVVGRKSINGECRYIIKNTWGKSCSYQHDVLCDFETGSYMVTREKLRKMTHSVTYIP